MQLHFQEGKAELFMHGMSLKTNDFVRLNDKGPASLVGAKFETSGTIIVSKVRGVQWSIIEAMANPTGDPHKFAMRSPTRSSLGKICKQTISAKAANMKVKPSEENRIAAHVAGMQKDEQPREQTSDKKTAADVAGVKKDEQPHEQRSDNKTATYVAGVQNDEQPREQNSEEKKTAADVAGVRVNIEPSEHAADAAGVKRRTLHNMVMKKPAVRTDEAEEEATAFDRKEHWIKASKPLAMRDQSLDFRVRYEPHSNRATQTWTSAYHSLTAWLQERSKSVRLVGIDYTSTDDGFFNAYELAMEDVQMCRQFWYSNRLI